MSEKTKGCGCGNNKTTVITQNKILRRKKTKINKIYKTNSKLFN